MTRTLSLALALMAAATLVAGAADAQGKRGQRRLDPDGDGKITQQEFVASRGAIFERIDLDHDGKITREELAAFRARMETASAGAMIRSGKERAGAGGGGQLDRLESLARDGVITRADWDAAIAKRFERLDTSHLGYLTPDQLRPRREASMTEAAPGGADPRP